MPSRTDWRVWAEVLRSFNLHGLASWILEAGSPLRLLGAQALYISQPFLGGKNMEAVARMLENEDETQAFIQYLRGEFSQ
jgi:hypothetical protein